MTYRALEHGLARQVLRSAPCSLSGPPDPHNNPVSWRCEEAHFKGEKTEAQADEHDDSRTVSGQARAPPRLSAPTGGLEHCFPHCSRKVTLPQAGQVAASQGPALRPLDTQSRGFLAHSVSLLCKQNIQKQKPNCVAQASSGRLW